MKYLGHLASVWSNFGPTEVHSRSRWEEKVQLPHGGGAPIARLREFLLLLHIDIMRTCVALETNVS